MASGGVKASVPPSSSGKERHAPSAVRFRARAQPKSARRRSAGTVRPEGSLTVMRAAAESEAGWRKSRFCGLTSATQMRGRVSLGVRCGVAEVRATQAQSGGGT